MTHPRRRTTARLSLAVVACLLMGALFSAGSLAATARTVPTAGEAWYEAPVTGGDEEDPSCTLPTDCVPAALPVAAGEQTLQVASTGGRDRARTFVGLDLTDIPEGAFVTGGTLRLPILQSEDSGSFRPETAQLRACLALGVIKDTQGGAPAQQPDYSCDSATRLVYDAKAKPPAFTADLAPLAAGLSAGGVAIVPSRAAQESGATFQVAFPTTKHPSKAHITATVTYEEAPSFAPLPSEDPGTSLPPFDSGDPFDPAPQGAAPPIDSPLPAIDDPVSQDVADLSAPPAAAAAEQPVAAGPAQQPAAAVPVAMIPVGYAYPAVWLAPLALLGVAALLARALTGEIVLPPEGAAPPDLLSRLVAAVRPAPPA